ncbi:MAG: FtsH protease activity modulator HflK [Spirochaetaceae bacterium]|jgi:membrane protease subunit HflK|nr:FtsH protease activity modulator HflK [Spirochaetaceae bacterium]
MSKIIPFRVPKFFKPATAVLAVAAILAVILAGTSFFIVDQAEEAVITRFGKYHATEGPGLRFKLPFGIDRHYLVNVKNVQTEQFGFRTLQSGISATYTSQSSESTMLTGDLNIIEVEWIIQYRITDPVAWIFNVNEKERTIRDVSRSAINMLVGDRAIMDIMGPERSAIESEGALFMNDTFRRIGLGIDVIAVKLQNIDPPAGVQEAFDDVNKAEQDMNRLINEGQQSYNAEIPRARGEREQVIQEAQGYAAERVNRASGDVARFNAVYDEYRRAPEVTRQRLYYEMVEDVFGGAEGGTVIIDRDFDNFLPLRNLGQ